MSSTSSDSASAAGYSLDPRREIASAFRFMAVLVLVVHAILTAEESLRVPHLFPQILAPKLLAAAVSVGTLAILQTGAGVRNVVAVGLTSMALGAAPVLWLASLLEEPFLVPVAVLLLSLLSAVYVPWPAMCHALVAAGGAVAIVLDASLRGGGLNLEPIAVVGLVLTVGTVWLAIDAETKRLRLRDAHVKLSESEERFRQLAESSSDIIWIWEPDGQLEYVSPAYELYTGRSPDELYRDSEAVLDIVHSGDRRAFARSLKLIGRGRARTMELRLQHADGTTHYMEVRGAPIFDERGEVRRCIGIWRDVTSRVRRARELDLEAATDPLTGAHNRRFFREMAHKEISRSRRTGRPLSLILFDLDHFKKINDQHGHLAGDRVLAECARLGRDIVRGSDTFARYGGEEFVLLLPAADMAAAASVAETLRAGIAAHRFEHAGIPITVTVSAGVATLDCDDSESAVDSLVERADDALYKAKESGRNTVRTWRHHAERPISEALSARLDLPRLSGEG